MRNEKNPQTGKPWFADCIVEKTPDYLSRDETGRILFKDVV